MKLHINENRKLSHIEPEVYGHFSEHLGRCIYGGLYVGENSEIINEKGMRKDVVDALKAIKIPVLRWPGGNFADEYHWLDGVGPKDKRKKMINTHWGGVIEDNSFGTHEYFELCSQLGCKTYVNGNVGSGTVREMSEWVEYMTFGGVSPMAELREKNGRKEPWTVVRDEEGSLRLQHEETGEPSSWTVDENIAELLISVATNLTYEDIFSEKRSEWEDAEEAFGLKEPQVTAVFRFTDDTDVTVHIGKSADPENNRYYYMSVDGDEHLYAVSAGITDDLVTEQTLLHPVPRLEIQSALLDRISVKNVDGSLRKEWRLQGDVKDRDAAENWLLTAPYTYPADYDSISNLKENAGNLRLGIFVDEANQETLKLYGFEEPAAIIEFHTAAGSTGTVGMNGVFDVSDWEEHLYTLTIGGTMS